MELESKKSTIPAHTPEDIGVKIFLAIIVQSVSKSDLCIAIAIGENIFIAVLAKANLYE